MGAEQAGRSIPGIPGERTGEPGALSLPSRERAPRREARAPQQTLHLDRERHRFTVTSGEERWEGRRISRNSETFLNELIAHKGEIVTREELCKQLGLSLNIISKIGGILHRNINEGLPVNQHILRYHYVDNPRRGTKTTHVGYYIYDDVDTSITQNTEEHTAGSPIPAAPDEKDASFLMRKPDLPARPYPTVEGFTIFPLAGAIALPLPMPFMARHEYEAHETVYHPFSYVGRKGKRQAELKLTGSEIILTVPNQQAIVIEAIQVGKAHAISQLEIGRKLWPDKADHEISLHSVSNRISGATQIIRSIDPTLLPKTFRRESDNEYVYYFEDARGLGFSQAEISYLAWAVSHERGAISEDTELTSLIDTYAPDVSTKEYVNTFVLPTLRKFAEKAMSEMFTQEVNALRETDEDDTNSVRLGILTMLQARKRINKASQTQTLAEKIIVDVEDRFREPKTLLYGDI